MKNTTVIIFAILFVVIYLSITLTLAHIFYIANFSDIKIFIGLILTSSVILIRFNYNKLKVLIKKLIKDEDNKSK